MTPDREEWTVVDADRGDYGYPLGIGAAVLLLLLCVGYVILMLTAPDGPPTEHRQAPSPSPVTPAQWEVGP